MQGAALAAGWLRRVLELASVERAVDAALADLPTEPSLILGGGKAGAVMARRAAARFPGVPGAVAVPEEHAGRAGAVDLLAAGHPLPTAGSLAAVARQEALAAARPGEALFLLSGGATALLAAPEEALTLDDLRAVYRAVLGAGLDIGAMNAVRKHLTRWGGGKLARVLARPVTELAVSDVLDDDPAVIGSGPLAADPTTFRDAARFLERLEVPPAVTAFVRAGLDGRRPETVKPGDPALARVRRTVVLSNRTVVAGLARLLAPLDPVVLPPQTGDVEAVAATWAAVLRGRPGVYLAGGEPTVRLRGTGPGGRNQHLALAVGARAPAGEWLFASIATDGVDGNSANAGAFMSGALAVAGRADIDDGLARFASAETTARLGVAFNTGPTGTNVADIHLAVVGADVMQGLARLLEV